MVKYEDHLGLVRHCLTKLGITTNNTYYEDLYQEGCIGLMLAVRGFDEKFARQFATYAVPTIRGRILRYQRDVLKRPIKISRNAVLVNNKVESLNGDVAKLPKYYN